MQAMQSSTASGWVGYSGQFAALRHISRQMNLTNHKTEIMPRTRMPVATDEPTVAAGVAEGAGLAHDAGNLLGALSLYSDLLGMPGVLHDEHREYANELRLLSDRSWAMIDRLVNHARQGHKATEAEETVVLPQVIDRCKGLLCRIAGRTVETVYGVGAYEPVNISAEAVERIVTNLVKNAAEATPWVGAISVEVEGATETAEDGERRRRVKLIVRDLGCGMDAAAVKDLMQGACGTKASGRGLGFRVVRELVALSCGSLHIESQPELGTSVSMEWYGARPVERPPASGIRRTDKMLWREAAGWIAC